MLSEIFTNIPVMAWPYGAPVHFVIYVDDTQILVIQEQIRESEGGEPGAMDE